MKDNFIFCCNNICRNMEMHKLASKLSSYSVNKAKQAIISGDETYWFIVGINEHPEKLYGFNVNSWRTCGRVFLELPVLSYLKAHTERWDSEHNC